ncbi:uncharacterized protein LOC116265001 [Nymphaea colorata]|nr:uncharacterized protein LOC116265001 [Nymphaea colorata]
MVVKIVGEIERLDAKQLSYHDFVENYMKRNQPVLLTGLMDGWQACKDWVKPNGEPNLAFFSTHFGKSKVQVADCGTREFTDQKRKEMSVSEFIGHWERLLEQDGNESLLYLKDWHFVKEYPTYVAYATPHFFLDDWLNMYLDSYHMHEDTNSDASYELNCSDYRFVYMGCKGTWTPLHADVFRSYSWSANVCGKKVWHFLSPLQSHLIFDRNLKNSVYDIFDDVSDTQFPGFRKTVWMRCTQEKNEVIFVPSGWYHQVHNLEDTISINHNWFNAHNLFWVWSLLVKDYNEAKEYIEDIRDICDDFEGLCQRNLAANTGMNFPDFFTFIGRFAIANMNQLHQLEDKGLCINLAKARHLYCNLLSIHKVAEEMKSAVFFKAEHSHELTKNESAFQDIKSLFREPKFHELCMSVNRIYGTLATSARPDNEMGKVLGCSAEKLAEKESRKDLDIISDQNCNKDVSFSIWGPEDLARVIDCTIRNFKIFSS